MVFSSLLFIVFFLPTVLLLYYISPPKFRNWILLISSFIFYAWGEPIYIVLLLVSTTTDFWLGKWIGNTQRGERSRKTMLIISIAINLAVLFFFKYAGFLIDNLNNVLGTNIADLDLPLPIGISFYTFQSISYIVDVYRRKVEPQQHWVPFATYIALFPQLVAGPIVQYSTIAAQLNHRKFKESEFAEGIQRFIRGLAKKVLLANNIGLLWDHIQSQPMDTMSIWLAWLGIIAFAFQIYFDFSGYSDMAIGLGLMFGFRFNENFNLPYLARSITDFWRRWHISLSSWFRDYVYIPLGGNRQGLWKQLRNIMIVWALTGIWHGASWNFALWGIYFGIILICEKLFLLKWLTRSPRWLQHSYAIILILCGWVLFVFEDMTVMGQYIMSMLGLHEGSIWISDELLFQLRNYFVLLAILVIVSISPKFKWWNRFTKSTSGLIIVWAIHMLLMFVSIAYLVDASFNPFLYFRF
ncbi:MAG: MBOAT family protein [Candidatus Pristimantibacillus lignocellulolyticus]|uniref:MBOAT family protein n=1 Tax=Candidatus Pristimantibacillus lignocellulolyticus TaxID=2994561 RepID=A0A9J6ZFX3_9BACL|nr:MAG: MBOAT family protein [Candidatus Pristimantibacillus lignocellulolyticus]